MDANWKASKSGEIGMTAAEVVIAISGEGFQTSNGVDSGHRSSTPAPAPEPAPGPVHSSSPEIARFSPSPNKPPRPPNPETLSRRKSLARSVLSKPKSRFGEPSVPLDSNLIEEIGMAMQGTAEQRLGSPIAFLSNQGSPASKMALSSTTLKESMRSDSFLITPRTPLMASPGGEVGEDDDEKIFKKVTSRRKLKYRRVKMMVLVEWIVFFCLLATLVASLTVHELEHDMIWGLEVWKWCLLVLVTFSGLLVTKWSISFVVFLIERNYLFRKKVLYFVHGLRKSVRVCIWLALVLLTWVLLFNHGVHRSEKATEIFDKATKILHYVTLTIVSLLIGSFLWVLKTLLLKILASSFHVNRFFDRIQESIFHQYIVQTLSGPPVLESEQMISRTNTSLFSFRMNKKKKDGKEKDMIDIEKLYRMKQEKVSAWTMKVLVDFVSTSGLCTITNALEENFYDGGDEQTDKEISNEMEAIAAAYHIFKNVAHTDGTYIYEEDLRRFLIKEEVDAVFPLFEGSETGRIDRKALTDWVVKVYKGRKALAHALNDTKTAVKQLDKLVTGILVIIIIIVWLLLMEIATTKVLLVLSSQLVVAAFMFGNTCKTIFEAIIFVFVMHPFDVGDRCVIDGVQMVVEEMNILTTVFLRYDNEMIYYPNSVLATKPISNFYRSPDMGDSFEFSIDFRTPVEKVGALKDKIKMYLERNFQHWHPSHNLVVKEIENVNKIKMALFFSHKMNFQEYGEKMRRRTELVIQMKQIFEELGINYNLLPQEVHLVQ
ncbi:mechanosensitive ion channel protein 10-like [Diospyros lotus]|uniref:mechanosensitive ion channel protein 10-like n=1 Tax=Diospyros lotus TaxID=55363 RepID=UPI00224C8CA8|nr:mechanosensitive ion channel protein 10-like [Diospyros lotus]XP_052210182.1 mechanosensitive ion channel protein 10-like [Diospyros lotus]